ncbi:putative cfem domain protein [Diplodia seriata]|uniref:Putative cfem domain protein n=1 Tax=Diplodia seriata TaxID=420778 RepID=A0A0G2EC34_9PEZI|nr:putative cfem domain protein [Diplodia seriata]
MRYDLQRHVGGRINRSGRFKHHFGHFYKSFFGLKRRIVVVVLLTIRRDVPGALFTDCYPSQFISGYTSVFNMTSSIAPIFSPLVCPEAWETVNTFSSSYIACCPSGYALNPPSTTVDSRRPAYGGTCYSSVAFGSTYTVTAYNASTLTATQAWPATNSLDQFYAHVIEGYALSLRPASVH